MADDNDLGSFAADIQKSADQVANQFAKKQTQERSKAGPPEVKITSIREGRPVDEIEPPQTKPVEPEEDDEEESDDILTVKPFQPDDDEPEAEEDELDDVIYEEEDEVKGFDVSKAFDEIKGIKASELRKHTLKLKAEKLALEVERDRYKQDLTEREERLEKMEKDLKANRTAPAEMRIGDHEPYQELVKRYEKNLSSTYNRLRSSSARTAIKNHHTDLRIELTKIRALDGEQYDDKSDEFDSRLQDMFGSDSTRVRDFLDEGVEIEMEGRKIINEFQAESTTTARKHEAKVYSKYARDTSDHLNKFWDVPEAVLKENPYTLRAFVSQLAKSDKKFEKYIKSDIDAVIKLKGGVAPFDPDAEEWRGMDPEEARDLWIEQYEKVQKAREGQVPELLAEAAMARRLVPFFIRRIRELEGKRVKVPKGSNPGRPSSGYSKKPKDAKEASTMAEREAREAIDALG